MKVTAKEAIDYSSISSINRLINIDWYWLISILIDYRFHRLSISSIKYAGYIIKAMGISDHEWYGCMNPICLRVICLYSRNYITKSLLDFEEKRNYHNSLFCFVLPYVINVIVLNKQHRMNTCLLLEWQNWINPNVNIIFSRKS
jgi:hypothetical protein